ncbi:MAG: hypothetical protein K2K54_06175 [Lachnospiraceae bacterium]|nr:hypothetical protein [Lachnospiraceae bacterium]
MVNESFTFAALFLQKAPPAAYGKVVMVWDIKTMSVWIGFGVDIGIRKF